MRSITGTYRALIELLGFARQDDLDQALAREQGRPLPRQLLQHVPAYDTAEPARQRT